MRALAVCGTPNFGLQIDGAHMHVVKPHFAVTNGVTPASNGQPRHPNIINIAIIRPLPCARQGSCRLAHACWQGVLRSS